MTRVVMATELEAAEISVSRAIQREEMETAREQLMKGKELPKNS